MPDQSPRVLGAEVLGFGLLPWLTLIGIHVDAVRSQAGPSWGFLVCRIVLAQGAALPLLTAGVSLLLLTACRSDRSGHCTDSTWVQPSSCCSGTSVMLAGGDKNAGRTGALVLSYDHRPPLTTLALCYVTELTLGWIVAEPSRTGRGVSQ